MPVLPPIENVARSLSRVTTAMCGRTFRPGTVVPSPWRTVVLPIAGAFPLSIALSSDHRGCTVLAASMLCADEDDLELSTIDDSLRELLNMTAGQLKAELALDQALGLPRVVDSDRIFQAHGWTHHALDSDAITVVVSLTTATY
jgi:hypothetical protein